VLINSEGIGMIQLIAFIQILIQIITVPLYLLGFYLLYYMIFEDFKLGFMLIFANAVFGWLIVFIDNGLTLYKLRLRVYASCETEEIKEEMKKLFKDGKF
jgi:hypothetical protein